MNMYLEPQRLKKRKKGRKDQPDDLQPRSSHEHESSTPKTQKEKERKKNINLMTWSLGKSKTSSWQSSFGLYYLLTPLHCTNYSQRLKPKQLINQQLHETAKNVLTNNRHQSITFLLKQISYIFHLIIGILSPIPIIMRCLYHNHLSCAMHWYPASANPFLPTFIHFDIIQVSNRCHHELTGTRHHIVSSIHRCH